MGALEGGVALVTGGGSGIGRGIVRRFIAEGARVGVLGRGSDRLAELRRDFGGAVVATQGDVTRYADNARAVADTVAAFGRLDVFVGNAGVFDNFLRLRDVPGEELGGAFDELFGVNVKGYLLGAKAALAALEQTAGSIIFTASTSSFQAGFGGILYVPAKHAVAGLTRQLALELAPTIRVNAVALGYVPTELTGVQALGQARGTADPAAVVQRVPLKLIPDPDDVAGLYVLLASSENNRFVTGTIILADGGQTLWGPPH